MHEEEIDMVEAKLAEARFEGASQGIGGELVVPDLGGDEEVSAVYAGGRARAHIHTNQHHACSAQARKSVGSPGRGIFIIKFRCAGELP